MPHSPQSSVHPSPLTTPGRKPTAFAEQVRALGDALEQLPAERRAAFAQELLEAGSRQSAHPGAPHPVTPGD